MKVRQVQSAVLFVALSHFVVACGNSSDGAALNAAGSGNGSSGSTHSGGDSSSGSASGSGSASSSGGAGNSAGEGPVGGNGPGGHLTGLVKLNLKVR